ncbi:MAG: hypothetical protein IKA64_06945 [Clostridia bacterium]|nr:hypothetical protein [Clostridia bacterium]
MKLLIAGSRGIKNFDLSAHVPSDTELIITGGATGVDALAEEYADRHKISKLVLLPRYNLYGKYAPLKRNEEMVDLADYVLVIWDGHSRGSRHTIDYARRKGKALIIVKL